MPNQTMHRMSAPSRRAGSKVGGFVRRLLRIGALRSVLIGGLGRSA